MIIVRFTTEQDAIDKLDEYNELAFPDGNPNHFTLTSVQKHTTENIWWFNGTDCINNGGLGRQEIEDDIALQDTFEVSGYPELISLGYLPDPGDD